MEHGRRALRLAGRVTRLDWFIAGLLRPFPRDLARVRALVAPQLAMGARIELSRIKSGSGRTPWEQWGIPQLEARSYMRRFAVEGLGLAAVALLALWSAAAGFSAGGLGWITGGVSLLFALVTATGGLVAWWRRDCLRAGRVIGFLPWLGSGPREA